MEVLHSDPFEVNSDGSRRNGNNTRYAIVTTSNNMNHSIYRLHSAICLPWYQLIDKRKECLGGGGKNLIRSERAKGSELEKLTIEILFDSVFFFNFRMKIT